MQRKTFVVLAKSMGRMPDGKGRMVLMAQDGDVWEVMSTPEHEPLTGERLSVKLNEQGEPMLDEFDFSQPRQLNAAPIQVAENAFLVLPDPNENLIKEA